MPPAARLKFDFLPPNTQAFAVVMGTIFPTFPAALNPELGLFVASRVRLTCYEDMALIRLVPQNPRSRFDAYYVFVGTGFVHHASGDGTDMSVINAQTTPNLPAAAEECIRLGLMLAHNQDGALVEGADEIFWAGRPAAEVPAITPLQISAPDRNGRVAVVAILQIQGHLHRHRYTLWPDGLLQLNGAELLFASPQLAAPPPCLSFAELLGTAEVELPVPEAAGMALALNDRIYEGEVCATESDESAPAAVAMTFSGAAASTPWDIGRLFVTLAGSLLSHAVRSGFAPGLEEGSEAGFFAYLNEFRPSLVIETPYRELRTEFAQHIARGVELPINHNWEAGVDSDGNRPNLHLGTEEVVLLTGASFVPAAGQDVDIWSMLAPVIRGPHIVLIVTERIASLPQDVRDMIDLSIRVPRMDEAIFWASSGMLFNTELVPREAEWVRHVTPRDMARIAAATNAPDRYLTELEARITRRLAQ